MKTEKQIKAKLKEFVSARNKETNGFAVLTMSGFIGALRWVLK